MKNKAHILWFDKVCRSDVPNVGGKNAALGELYSRLKNVGVQVPYGFATTADSYREFLAYNQLDEPLAENLEAYQNGRRTLKDAGHAIRQLIAKGNWPPELAEMICAAYRDLGTHYGQQAPDVAVRSSATAEDLPEASFAGQQETFLNVTGEQNLLDACRRCFASLYTDRAICYREEKGFDHLRVSLSVGIQKMVRSDRAGAGVMFSIDTETGFPDIVTIDAAWGLGESVVQGSVTPDNYTVFKPLLAETNLKPILQKTMGSKACKLIYSRHAGATVRSIPTPAHERHEYVLNDEEILQLAHWAMLIENHFDTPMDIEWAKDGDSGDLFIVQARPETVQSQRDHGVLKSFHLEETGELMLEGLAIGEAISSGPVQLIRSTEDMAKFEAGSILVTGMTDPDWVPIMKQAAGIITDHGGRTSHAAIVSRELGVTAVVGTGHATEILKDGSDVTLSCAEGDQGKIYAGRLAFSEIQENLDDLPKLKTHIMLNIATPAAALRWWRLPCQGIGLARMEFIVNSLIKVHPMALVHYNMLEDKEAREQIRRLTRNYMDKKQYFVDQLSQGIATIAASQYPDPVIVRMSDFKTNEYAELVGGRQFEFHEENPMLGFRGASRYYDHRYKEGFGLECMAIKRVREQVGMNNVIVMIPFCRTLEEADKVLEVMAEFGLKRGQEGLKVYVMVEIPANVILAEQFAQRFDGFSIGSNDLTQLTLGVDRDSEVLQGLFSEQDPAVKAIISQVIHSARKTKTKIGICGQAPSDYPEFAEFLVAEGIDTISLNPDSVIGVVRHLAHCESNALRR